ncbi:hypothetical protein BDB00DRAFT_62183 [Zychaea mexicana]|uniref:uncharacterized protein n=1 Tax=Zychaea mexicana TaxID=64656 RepID=UPI0022FDD511|nr:uncharacterized protein BDB00DRAFT_62183 [Zychaea mexicana]KAI9488161.1 hypothetical protein BDB00DRAFT_62183 [Zychaea mexicana]
MEFEGEDEVNTIWVNETDLIPYNESAKDGCASFSALEKQGGSTKGLDQTGAFACTCGHHGYPIAIVDMRSKGERYTYILSLLKKVTETELYGNDIRIMYDVGCKLRTALKTSKMCLSQSAFFISLGIILLAKFTSILVWLKALA